MHMTEPPVTLKQVAIAAGVSVNTVSAVMRGRSQDARISERLSQRVRSVADSLQYRPNASARSTRTGRFGGVGLLLSAIGRRSSLPPALFRGIHDALAQRDLHLTTAVLPDAKLAGDDLAPKVLREFMVDAFLINYTDNIPPAMLESIRRHHLPSVWLNAKLGADAVYYDERAGAAELTRRLLEMGHRRIAYYDAANRSGLDNPHYSCTDRELGYAQVLVEAGLRPRVVRRSASEFDQVAVLRDLLSTPDRATAVVCYSDRHAVTVAYVGAMLGLRVPEDLSVAGFESEPTYQLGKRITAMSLPEHAAGHAAVEEAVHKVEAPQSLRPPRVLPLHFEPGMTAAPPPS